jgi:hypothetical protein
MLEERKLPPRRGVTEEASERYGVTRKVGIERV